MLIAHLTDLHVRPHGLPANRVVETNRMCANAVRAVLRLAPRPDCVIISGDLTDNGLVPEYSELRRLLAPLDMPVYMVPGNHDRRDNFQEAFKDYPGIDPAAEFVQYTVEQFPVRLVALDTVVFGAGHGVLTGATLDWLDAALAREPAKPTLIFMHHPPFRAGDRDMDRIRLLDGTERFREIVAKSPQIEHVLCGHHHRSIHVRFAGTVASTGPSTVDQSTLDFTGGGSQMIMEPPAFQVHLHIEGQGVVSHMVYVADFEGPYPYLRDADYPGAAVKA